MSHIGARVNGKSESASPAASKRRTVASECSEPAAISEQQQQQKHMENEAH